MKKEQKTEIQTNPLCRRIRTLIEAGALEQAEVVLAAAMGEAPHAPEPHNLIGIILEKKHDHVGAMKHFRAAWVLDPSYRPARINMEQYGDPFPDRRRYIFDVGGCPEEEKRDLYKVEYDGKGIGHMVKRK